MYNSLSGIKCHMALCKNPAIAKTRESFAMSSLVIKLSCLSSQLSGKFITVFTW